MVFLHYFNIIIEIKNVIFLKKRCIHFCKAEHKI